MADWVGYQQTVVDLHIRRRPGPHHSYDYNCSAILASLLDLLVYYLYVYHADYML